MKVYKQGLWAVLAAVLVFSTSWAQYPHGATDTTYGLRSRIADNPSFSYKSSPEDWRDINIYQIFTDRFADGDSNNNTTSALGRDRSGWYVGNRNFPENRNFHHGGDWKGLKDNLDYLSTMGVNAIWMSGVQFNDQGKDSNYTPYHMYHPTDFFRVDPAMGTFQELKDLVDACHTRGIYVILDVVVNHTADLNGLWGNNQLDDKQYWGGGNGTHGWWDSRRHGAPFDDLQYFHNNGTIKCWDCFPESLLGQFKGTDDLKTESSHVTYWLTEAFKNLIDATDCDGFRVDAIKHVEYEWIKKWADDMRKHAATRGKNDFILFGEYFSYDNNALASYCKDPGYSFNSALFFPMSQTFKSVFIDGGGSGQLTSQLNNRSQYGEGADRLVTFIDNHDVNRIGLQAGGNIGTIEWVMPPALTFLYTATPVPCLFYGTEHGFQQGGHWNGSNASANSDDADWQRECMFDRGFQPGPAQGNKLTATSAPLYQHIKKLNQARATYKSLTRGTFTERWNSGGRGPYAYSRIYDDQEALVALNTADGNQSINPTVGKPNGTEFINVLNPTETVTVSGNKISFSLAGKESKIFVAGNITPSLWVRGTHTFPAPGSIDSTTPIYMNTEAGPAASVTNVSLVYSINNGVTWTSKSLTVNAGWSSQGGSWYNGTIGTLPAGSIVQYAVAAQGDGAETWDNNGGSNYTFTVAQGVGNDPWIRGTRNFPEDGDATSASDLYVDTEAGPSNVITSVTAYYIVNGSTTSVAMVKNTTWGSSGGNWYNINLGKFAAGSVVKYFVRATDGTNTVTSDNGGLLFTVSIRGASLAITNPSSDLAVGFTTTNVMLQGTAETNVVGPLAWTNTLTGASGTQTIANAWTIPSIGLGVGANEIIVSARRPGIGLGGTVASDNGANYGAGWTNTANKGTGFGPWQFNHSQGSGFAGVFVGDPAAASMSGFGATAFGFYANPPGSGANAEVLRDFSNPMSVGSTFTFDLGLNWDSNAEGSYRGFSLLSGTNELLFINMSNSQTVRVNNAVMFANYGAQKMTLNFEYLASGSIRVSGTGRDGSESYNQTLVVPAGAPSRIKFYFNATDSEADERQMYVDNFQITSPEGENFTPVSASITIARGDEDDTDTNGDGVPDWWYVQQGLNPADPDIGSERGPNGYTYIQSYVMNLNPADTNLPPFQIGMAGNGPNFSAPGEGRRYMYQFTPALDQPFQDVGEPVFAGGTMTFNGEEVGFYRIRYVNEGGTGNVESVVVSATPGSQTFNSPTGLAVRLNVSGVNVVSSEYSLNLGSRVDFRNSDVITIGAGLTNNQVVTLTLYGETANGTRATATYGYTRIDTNQAMVLTSVAGTHHWVSDENQVFINSAGYPEGSTVSADIIYCINGGCTGNWPLVQMSRNPDWENGDWWNKDLGMLNDGDTVEFAIVMRDAFNNEVWDNNGGGNYVVTIGGGGSFTNGPNTPYSTNPTFGQRGTKTIDGNTSDWSDAQLIALDMANDDPRSLGSNWTLHEAPLDLTHVWAAWDDNNLYLAWQYVDVTDVIDPANAGGAGSGKISSNDGILQWIVIDTVAGQGATSDVWGKFNSWTGPNKPNYQIYLAGSLWQGYISRAVGGTFALDDGGVNYKTVAAAGITVAKASAFAATSMRGVGDADNRTGGANRNFLNEGHSTTRDSFYEMSIPLSYLGITAATLDNNGIGGVMIGAGSASAMDSIPHDETTLNTQGVEAWNSSLEWGDVDTFTSPFARIGGN